MKNYFNAVSKLSCFVLAFALIGCASTKVERIERAEKVDLSGQWNDYDALLVSQEMVKDSLEKAWLINFVEQYKRKPVVIVGHVANRSYEHINAQVFTKNLEQELLNSGKVLFVASSEEREDVRAEREDQQKGNTSVETMKAKGKERGADLILLGSINSIKDEVKGKAVLLYQVNLELIDLTTNDKLWIGQKEIKKFVKNPKFSF